MRDTRVQEQQWPGLTEQFMTEGGCELGCMSTTTNMEVAKGFAMGDKPLIFKYTTKNAVERGADIKFLSVFPNEKEVLYPPLTFLRYEGMKDEDVAGTTMRVVSLHPQIVGN